MENLQSINKTSINQTTINQNDQDEILLKENPNRYVLFPIKYDQIWKKYKEAEA